MSSAPLKECARGAHDATIVVSDHTRETAIRDVLPPVLDRLRGAGIPTDKISVLVAYGNHTSVGDDAIRAMLGRLPRGVRVLHHDSSDAAGLVALGKLPSRKTFAVNSHAARAQMLVITGAITFHYHAGFTGGRKALLPGLAARANILENHARTLSSEGRDPRCQPGMMDGNPVSEEMEHAARLIAGRLGRAPFLVNTVLTESGSLAAVFAGDLFEAHRRGAAFVGERFRVGVSPRYDVALASAGGSPRDATFYQAHKAFDHAARAVRDGGVVVLAAECPQGAGKGFMEWFAYGTYEGHLSALRNRFAVPGQTALALRQKLGRIRGILVSRMNEADVVRMGLVPAHTLKDAFAAAREMAGCRRLRACAMPHASTVLPVEER